MGETPQEIEAKAMNLLSAFHDRGGFILSSGCEIPPESTPENPEAAVEVVSPFAGFVGSDLLAGVLATHLTDRPGGLLIDFGTNSELALWDGATLWVTSAAGGPAFEGCGIQCGMPAEPGAIYRIDLAAGSHRVAFSGDRRRRSQRPLRFRPRRSDRFFTQHRRPDAPPVN